MFKKEVVITLHACVQSLYICVCVLRSQLYSNLVGRQTTLITGKINHFRVHHCVVVIHILTFLQYGSEPIENYMILLHMFEVQVQSSCLKKVMLSELFV